MACKERTQTHLHCNLATINKMESTKFFQNVPTDFADMNAKSYKETLLWYIFIINSYQTMLSWIKLWLNVGYNFVVKLMKCVVGSYLIPRTPFEMLDLLCLQTGNTGASLIPRHQHTPDLKMKKYRQMTLETYMYTYSEVWVYKWIYERDSMKKLNSSWNLTPSPRPRWRRPGSGY